MLFPATYRAAYKRLLLAAHPDKGGSVESFERLQHAYCTLVSKRVGTCGCAWDDLQ